MPHFNKLQIFTCKCGAVNSKMQLKKLNCTGLTALATCWLSMSEKASAVSAVKFLNLYKVVKK